MWTNTSVGSDEITTVSGNLSYTGITSTGNSISLAGTGSDTRLPFTDTTSGELYASFLVSITDVTGISTTGSTYFAVLSNAANTFTEARIHLKTNGTTYQFGISPTNATTDIVWSANTYALGTTQYLVLKYDFTNDVLVLASHFNGLLNFGTVKVSVKYNYVEFIYSRDLLTYSLFPGEISSDTDIHFELTKDCFWSFTNLIETGDDPVFVFSELMRRNNKEDNTGN